MRAHKLFLTTSVRFAALYAVVFCASAGILLIFLYGTTVRAIDLEIDAALETELSMLAEVRERLGFGALISVLNERMSDSNTRFNAYLLVNPDMEAIAGNLPSWPGVTVETGKSVDFDVDEMYGSRLVPRLFRARSLTLPDGAHLLVAHGVERRVRIQETISRALLWGLAAALALGICGGLLSGRRVLRRTGEIADTAARIMMGDLTERIPVRGTNDEIDRLADQLNLMFERIELLLEGMRAVSDNIAHELRTPLTRLRAGIEASLTGPADADRYRLSLEEALKETGSVLKMFNALMGIAQARSQVLRDQMEYLDLNELVTDILELYEPALLERNITLKCEMSAADPTVFGHRQLLSQCFANLLDNAVKFTPAGGAIELRTLCKDGYAEFLLTDNGPGIPEESRDALLKPYARGDTRGAVPGLGLGLSLVVAVASLHSSSLQLSDNAPGLRVALRLPIKIF